MLDLELNPRSYGTINGYAKLFQGAVQLMFDATDYETVKYCPWCESKNQEIWGKKVRGFLSIQCRNCDLIYVKNRLNQSGLLKYYKEYLSSIHQADSMKNDQRKMMYELEFEMINKHASGTDVLDVGCSGGYFLNYFNKKRYECFGVDIGEEAAKEAEKKYKVWKADFAQAKINRKFDLIVFRGVIEHVAYPKVYLERAADCLNRNGLIFITSTPNAKALCCRLFKEKWNQHSPKAHLMHFSANHFDEWFSSSGFKKIDQHHFYEETSYANPKDDILKVAKAIHLEKNGKEIDFISPPFYGNMLSLIYRKT